MTRIDPKTVDSHGEDINRIKDRIKQTDIIMIGIIVVLFIGFLGLAVSLVFGLVDGYRSKETTYQDLSNKINEQAIKIDTLTNEIHRQKGFR